MEEQENQSTDVLKQPRFWLKVILIAQMVLAIPVAIFISFFLGIMATDSPSAGVESFMLGGVVGFLIIAIPGLGVPFLALRELKNHPNKKWLIFNWIDSFIFLFLFPVAILSVLAIIQIILLIVLYSQFKQTEPTS